MKEHEKRLRYLDATEVSKELLTSIKKTGVKGLKESKIPVFTLGDVDLDLDDENNYDELLREIDKSARFIGRSLEEVKRLERFKSKLEK